MLAVIDKIYLQSIAWFSHLQNISQNCMSFLEQIIQNYCYLIIDFLCYIMLFQGDNLPMENLSLYGGGGGPAQQRIYSQGSHMVSYHNICFFISEATL